MSTKYKCTCGNIWLGSEYDSVCPDSTDDYTGAHNHEVKETKSLSAEDYVALWEDNLENANRHSLTDLPSSVLKILRKHVSSKSSILKVLRELYKKDIGV